MTPWGIKSFTAVAGVSGLLLGLLVVQAHAGDKIDFSDPSTSVETPKPDPIERPVPKEDFQQSQQAPGPNVYMPPPSQVILIPERNSNDRDSRSPYSSSDDHWRDAGYSSDTRVRDNRDSRENRSESYTNQFGTAQRSFESSFTRRDSDEAGPDSIRSRMESTRSYNRSELSRGGFYDRGAKTQFDSSDWNSSGFDRSSKADDSLGRKFSDWSHNVFRPSDSYGSRYSGSLVDNVNQSAIGNVEKNTPASYSNPSDALRDNSSTQNGGVASPWVDGQRHDDPVVRAPRFSQDPGPVNPSTENRDFFSRPQQASSVYTGVREQPGVLNFPRSPGSLMK